MKNVASADQELSVEERNLLSVAYKNVIGARRASWRIVTSIEQKEESKGNASQATLIKEYREKIETELANICKDILVVLDEHLIKSAQSGESKVFYHKMSDIFHLLCFHVSPPLTGPTGRAITTDTSLNSPLAINARSLPMSLCRRTKQLPRLLLLISHQLILSVLALLSTFLSFTTRS